MTSSLPLPDITFRAATSMDTDWLVALRIRTMGPHLERSGEQLSADDHRARVVQDFDCIHIVIVDGDTVGMIKVVKEARRWRLVQIQLVPEHQGRGIGGQIVRRLLDDARRKQVPVTLSVLKVNPAKRLYDRLGFTVIATTARAYEMQSGL